MGATPQQRIWTVVVAAGSGTRFGGTIPKQFVKVGGRRIVDWSVKAAAESSIGVVVVLPPNGAHPDLAQCPSAEVRVVVGGASRSESVRQGLAAVDEDATVVLVHDAARPLASPELFDRVAQAIADGADAAVPVVPVVDTLRHVEGQPVDRSTLLAVQTPQGFTRDALERAHSGDGIATDDATLVTNLGGRVVTVAGERWNLKVTDPTDDLVVAALLENRS